MRIAVKEPGKELQIVETNEKYRSDCVKKIIGEDNYPEFIRLNTDGTMSLGVDDTGLMKNLPDNFYIKMNNPFFPIQRLVGTVVFVRTKYVNVYKERAWDYEVEDLLDKDIEFIKKDILNKELQEYLKMKYQTGTVNPIEYKLF